LKYLAEPAVVDLEDYRLEEHHDLPDAVEQYPDPEARERVVGLG
jgi:hypothetical protein